MRIVRYKAEGNSPRTGILMAEGINELGTASGDESSFDNVLETVCAKGPEVLESTFDRSTVRDRESVRLLPPITPARRLFCLGAVYTGHMQDAGLDLRFDPNQWLMPENAIIGPDDDIVLPERVADNVMPAAELCIVIGKPGKYIDPTEAYDHIAGFTISNDVTARTDWPGPMAYKMMDTFAPIGPHVTTADEVLHPMNLKIEMRQDEDIICVGSTAGMRFSISFLVSYLSTITELQPGDVISAGDPGGVKTSLRPGSAVEIEIEDVGTLTNDVVLEGID